MGTDMKNVTVNDIVTAVGGRLLCGGGDTVIENISLDSRSMKGADLFIPIRGENTDGHRYIAGAFSNGAAASFAAQDADLSDFLSCGGINFCDDNTKAVIVVDDTVKALQSLGKYLRKRLDMPFVGITGSVGKTSTREMVAKALSAGLKVTSTQGNFNGQLGVPVTLGNMDDTANAAVIEMGMSEPGEMARIAAIARPDIAVITNIGVSHIENLGSRRAIFEEKLHITDGFTKDNTLIINGGDDMLSALKGKTLYRLITCGMEPDNDFYAYDIQPDGQGTSFELCINTDSVKAKKKVRLSVPGRHNVMNAMTAVAAAAALGVDTDKAIEALKEFKGFKRRLEWIKAACLTILDDSYNASPESAVAAARVLADSDTAGRRVCIFADMLELGAEAQRLHAGVCAEIASLKPDVFITIGELAAKGAALAKAKAFSFADNGEAKEALPSILKKGDTVLVKGSNGMHLEEIVSFLRELIL